MKERPILFSGPMVGPILAGTKRMTRRIFTAKNGGVWPRRNDLPGMRQIFRSCPYGQIGDRLWVREAWARTIVGTGTEMIVYRACDNRTDYGGPWKPGIHMFRRDSRITLEVTGLRVEKLQDISEADAQAEGVDATRYGGLDRAHARAFSDLWEQINGFGSWAANPWCWVVEFKRVETA